MAYYASLEQRRQQHTADLFNLATQLRYQNVQQLAADYQQLATDCPFLAPGVDDYPKYRHSQKMLRLKGTVGMTFRGQQYDIPITVWVPFNYPAALPVCYVNVAPGMQLSPNHPVLAANGTGECVTRGFTPQPGSLSRVVRHLQVQFATQPPLFAAPAPHAQPATASSAPPALNPRNPGGYNGAGASVHKPSAAPPPLNPYGGGHSGKPPPSAVPGAMAGAAASSGMTREPSDDPLRLLNEHLRKEVDAQLKKLAGDLLAASEAAVSDVRTKCESLQASAVKAERSVAEQEARVTAEELELAAVQEEIESMEKFLAENDAPEDPTQMMPQQSLDAQIMELTAEVAAYDDMLHLLGREEGDAAQLTRSVMKIAHDKFKAVATLNKALKKKHKPE